GEVGELHRLCAFQKRRQIRAVLAKVAQKSFPAVAKWILDRQRIGNLMPLREEIEAGGTAPAEEGVRCVDRALRETAHAPGHCRATTTIDLNHHCIVAAHASGPAIHDNSNGTALELEERMGGILDIDVIEPPALIHALWYRGCHQGADTDHWRSQPINHVAPMRHHIERNTTTLGTPVIPAGALAFLSLAIEDPRSRIDLDRENAAKKTGILH